MNVSNVGKNIQLKGLKFRTQSTYVCTYLHITFPSAGGSVYVNKFINLTCAIPSPTEARKVNKHNAIYNTLHNPHSCLPESNVHWKGIWSDFEFLQQKQESMSISNFEPAIVICEGILLRIVTILSRSFMKFETVLIVPLPSYQAL